MSEGDIDPIVVWDELREEVQEKIREGEDNNPLLDDLDAVYIWLDQLRDDLVEAAAEYDPTEEVDRNLIRGTLDDLDTVQRVKELLQNVEDPRL